MSRTYTTAPPSPFWRRGRFRHAHVPPNPETAHVPCRGATEDVAGTAMNRPGLMRLTSGGMLPKTSDPS